MDQKYSRKLSLQTLHVQPPSVVAASPSSTEPSKLFTGENRFDANVVMVLAVLLCALICVLGLNSIIRCALRWSRRGAAAGGDQSRDRWSAQSTAISGIEKKALKTFTTVSYSAGLILTAGLASECVICISEFVQGERVKLLPKCNHGFHAKCIDKWLGSHSTCPTCRQCLLGTCKKIVGCSAGVLSESATVSQQHVIAPLEPEGLVIDYRGSC